MQVILFDLDGVIYLGDTAVPGAQEALRWVHDQGIPHRFVTNTTSRPRTQVGDKLRAMGIAVEDRLILTPPVAACEWLRRQGARSLALFTAPATRAEFAGFKALPEDQEEGADAVVLGKPAVPFFEAALAMLGTSPAETLMRLATTSAATSTVPRRPG